MADSAGLVAAVLGWLATYLLHSTALIGGALLLTRVVGVRPVARDALWKAAVLGGLVTTSVATGTGSERVTVRVLASAGEEADSARLVHWVAAGPEGSTEGDGPIRDEAVLEFVESVTLFGTRTADATRAGLGSIAPDPVRPRTVPPDPVRPETVVWSVAPLPARDGARAPGRTGAAPARGEERIVVAGGDPDRLRLRTTAGPGDEAALDCVRPGGSTPAVADPDAVAACLDRVLVGPPWREGLILLWLVGAGAALARMHSARRAIDPVRRSLTAASPRTARLAMSVLGPRPASRIRVRSSSVIHTPCVLPGGVVVITERAEAELEDAQLGTVIAHEAAHVLRRDGPWLTAMGVLASVLWFQPLNRLALRYFTDNAELACDDWAIERTRAPEELARSIATVAGWAVRPTPAVALPIVRPGGPTERVHRILTGSPPPGASRRGRALVLAILLGPAAFLPAVPVADRLGGVFVLDPGTVRVDLAGDDTSILFREVNDSLDGPHVIRRASVVLTRVATD